MRQWIGKSPELIPGDFFNRTTQFVSQKVGAIILSDLASFASQMAEGVFDRRKMSYGYEAYRDHVRLTERQVQQGLRTLERSGAIKLVRESGKVKSLLLTELGYKKSTEVRLARNTVKYLTDRYCQVTFDIPETHRSDRQRIRNLLKSFGFICIQRSVWRSDKKIHTALAKYFKDYYTEFNIQVSLCKVF
jgi:hypothetical protein